MKCEKHNCEMTEDKRVAWCGEKKKLVCPQCAVEQFEKKVQLAARGQSEPEAEKKLSRRGGW